MPARNSQKLVHNPKYLVVGPLHREFSILSNGVHKMDYSAGPALMAACGLQLWDQPIGLVSRVSQDYPAEWLNDMQSHGLDVRGIRQLSSEYDHRMFYGYESSDSFTMTGPVGFYAKNDLPYDPRLLNYRPPIKQKNPLQEILITSPRSVDLPADYPDAVAAHFCPMDFTTHSLLQSELRRGSVHNISLEANPEYLLPEYWNQIANVVAGLTAFIVQEKDARGLFRGRLNDLVEMAEVIAGWGCEMVVIRCIDGSKLLYENTSRKKWLIPEYPVERINHHSYQHAFGGGLLAGYLQTYQPLDSILYGSVSESIAGQGLSPYYLLDTLTGFAQARLDKIRELVQPL